MFQWATDVDVIDCLSCILFPFLLTKAAFLWFRSIPDWLKIIPPLFAKDWFMNGLVNPNEATEK